MFGVLHPTAGFAGRTANLLWPRHPPSAGVSANGDGKDNRGARTGRGPMGRARGLRVQ